MLLHEKIRHLERIARAACRYRDARCQFLQSLQRPGDWRHLQELYLHSHAAEEALLAALEEQERAWSKQNTGPFSIGPCLVAGGSL